MPTAGEGWWSFRRGRTRAGAAVGVAAIVAAVVIGSLTADGDGSVPTASPVATDQVSGPPRLAETAWWDSGLMGFGSYDIEPPNAPLQPRNYRQIRIGTLDGRVTRIMALPWDTGFVSGPFGTDVLIGDDHEGVSRLMLVSALDGSARELLETDALVPSAVISGDGAAVYYVRVDGATRIDDGLWRFEIETGVAQQIIAGPLGRTPRPGDEPELLDWWMLRSPDGEHLVIQSCFGEVTCATQVVDVDTLRMRPIDGLSWPRGITDRYLLARQEPDSEALVAIELETLARRVVIAETAEAVPVVVGSTTLVASGGFGGTDPLQVWSVDRDAGVYAVPDDRGAPDESRRLERLIEQHGVALPDGWVIRWPDPFQAMAVKAPDEIGAAELINVVTGERIQLEPWELATDAGDRCPVLVPSEMPGGRPAGAAIETLVDGIRYLEFGQGADRVVLAVGTPVLGTVADHPPPEVEIRGHEGRVVLIADEGLGEVALVWEEPDDCTYTAWLAAGTTIEEAMKYAGRY